MTVCAGGFADKASLVEAVLQAQAATDDLEPYEQYSEGGSESGEEQPQFPEDDDEAEDHEDLDTLCECSELTDAPQLDSQLDMDENALDVNSRRFQQRSLNSSRVATGLL